METKAKIEIINRAILNKEGFSWFIDCSHFCGMYELMVFKMNRHHDDCTDVKVITNEIENDKITDDDIDYSDYDCVRYETKEDAIKMSKEYIAHFDEKVLKGWCD